MDGGRIYIPIPTYSVLYSAAIQKVDTFAVAFLRHIIQWWSGVVAQEEDLSNWHRHLRYVSGYVAPIPSSAAVPSQSIYHRDWSRVQAGSCLFLPSALHRKTATR